LERGQLFDKGEETLLGSGWKLLRNWIKLIKTENLFCWVPQYTYTQATADQVTGLLSHIIHTKTEAEITSETQWVQ
jgi:hypothetical protein